MPPIPEGTLRSCAAGSGLGRSCMRSYRARERAVPPEELWPQIDALEAAIGRQDVEAALGV